MTEDSQTEPTEPVQATQQATQQTEYQHIPKRQLKPRRVPRTAWKKGQSGNPTGERSARTLGKELDLQSLARKQTRPALKVLTEIMMDKAAPQGARADAAKTILERGWGKAQQNVNIKTDFEASILNLITALDAKPLEDNTVIEHEPAKPALPEPD